MRAPMMSIHTVAAGGGSILHFDGARFRVGPGFGRRRSRPELLPPRRPADRHRRQSDDRQADRPSSFPKSSAPAQDQPLDAPSVRAAFEALASEIGDGRGAEEVADGFIAIAVAKMAEAIKKISVARGYDVTRYALNCFGGAGGQHACDVADALAIKTVLIHPLSSLLSAYGMGLADIRAHRGQGVEAPLDDEALARARAVAREARRRGGERSRGPGRRARRDQAARKRAIALRRLRHGARGRLARRRRDAPRLRARPPRALRLHRPRQAAGDRGGGGRGDRRRRRALPSARARSTPSAPQPKPATRDAVLLPRRLARGRRLSCARISRSARGSPARR